MSRSNLYIKCYRKCFLLLALITIIFNACANKSEEDFLLETIDAISDYAENRESNGILSYLSEDYNDDEGRNYQDVKKLIDSYLGKYRGIAVNVLSTKIISLNIPDAEIETDTSLSSGAAQLFRKAVVFSGQFYRFHLNMKKEGDQWKCTSASWRYISMDELFPESFKILKKLFPGSF